MILATNWELSKIVLSCIISFALVSCNTSSSSGAKNSGQQTPKYSSLSGKAPLIIAHRGASGYLPENTIASFRKAIELGADYIEPDLVMTKDSELVVRHEPMLSKTTNVSDMEAFASKKCLKNIDGVMIEDWFVSDFTLAEIKQLKAKQAFAERPQEFNNLYEIPSFREVIALVKEESANLKREIGIYPETKHPSFHEALHLNISDELLSQLTAAGWNNKESPVFVQSFEVSNLQYIRSRSTVKIIQLLSCYDVAASGELIYNVPDGELVSTGKPYDWHLKGDTRDFSFFITADGLDFVKTYANGIGVWKPFIIPYKSMGVQFDDISNNVEADNIISLPDKEAMPPTRLIEKAHDKKLLVHAYTFRNESNRLLNNYHNKPILEYRTFYDLGVDGIFTDFTDMAIKAK